MGCTRFSFVLCLAFLVPAFAMRAKDDCVDESAPGLFSPSSKNEGKLFRKSDAEEPVTLYENDEFDGGFSSLEQNLQWAIGRLAQAKLKETTQTVQRLSSDELKQRPIEIKDAKSQNQGGVQSAFRKAKDVVTSMLGKGFILGKDAVSKAKSLDEKHQLTSTVSTKIASFDQKIGLTKKISTGASVVNSKVKEMNQKIQVSEKTKTAFAAAEEKASNAGSAIMKNRYLLTGATWVFGAFNEVTKAAGKVGRKTKEKVEVAEKEQKRK